MSIDARVLARDILGAKNSPYYGEQGNKQYYLRYFAPGQLSPIRAYFRFRNEWWATVIDFIEYPLSAGRFLKDVVSVTFEYRIPPCPMHRVNWHPNIYASGLVCWGTSRVPGRTVMRVERLLDHVCGLLNNPSHDSPTHRQCGPHNIRIFGL